MKQVRPRYYVLTLVPLLVCLFVTGTILWQQGKDSHASIPSTSTPTPTAQRQQFAGYVLDKPTTTRGFTAVDTRLTIPCNTSTATSIPSNAGGPARNALLMYVGIGDNHLEDKEVGIAIQPNGSLGTFVTLLNGTDQFFPGPSSLKCGAQVVAHLEVKGRVAIQSQGNNHNKPLVSPVATKMSYAYQVSWSVSIIDPKTGIQTNINPDLKTQPDLSKDASLYRAYEGSLDHAEYGVRSEDGHTYPVNFDQIKFTNSSATIQINTDPNFLTAFSATPHSIWDHETKSYVASPDLDNISTGNHDTGDFHVTGQLPLPIPSVVGLG